MAYLNGNTRIIAVGGKQVNADWNETNPLSPAYIQNKPDISGALTRQIVDELPVTDIDPNCIYMVLKSDPDTGDYYDEFMYIDGNWEQIGSTQVAQVQSDWNETDPTSPAYIDNKPTIPTAVSDLTNDEGYITINDVPAQVQSDWNEADNTSPAYIDNKPNLATVATSGSYNDLSNTPDTLDFIVPFTEVSDVISTTVAKADIIAAMNAGKTVRATLNGVLFELVAYSASPEKMSFCAVIEDTTVSIVGKVVNDNWTWESYDTLLNVQADWNESDVNSPAYIENKPTIPTVNDATITIQQNGTTVGTFTTNDADDTTINLTGGGGDAWYGTQAEYDMLGADALIEGKDYYIETELAKVATSGQYADLKGAKPSAPVAFSNNYKDLTNAPTPTQSTFMGRKDLDWYGTQAEFDALEQAGQLEFYRNYYIEGEGPSHVVTGYGAAYTIRYISQSDYNNLGTYDANTIYLIY